MTALPTPVFGLTWSDLQSKICPINAEYTFSVSDQGNMTPERAVEILRAAEDQALMRVPTRYRQLLSAVDGEVIISNARGGETSLKIGLWPIISGTLELYKNYHRSAPWQQRDPGDQLVYTTDYTLDNSNGIITLTASLKRGDYVWAAYQHTAGSRMPGLRDIVLSIAAAETARQYSYFRTADGFDRFERWEISAYANLNQMKGLDLVDRLVLINETDDIYGGLLNL